MNFMDLVSWGGGTVFFARPCERDSLLSTAKSSSHGLSIKDEAGKSYSSSSFSPSKSSSAAFRMSSGLLFVSSFPSFYYSIVSSTSIGERLSLSYIEKA